MINPVGLTDHARDMMRERLGVKSSEAQLALAQELVRDGTYIGASSSHPGATHLLKHARAYFCVDYLADWIVVVSVWPTDWMSVRREDGTYWMRNTRPSIANIAEQLGRRFKVSRR